jgi:hypothetical protein
MSRGLVYTLHLWPPIAHAKHYTGTAKDAKRLPERLTEHALGRGARLTQVQVERGGSWVVAQTEPGGRDRERSLKQRGASRRCEVCKAVDGYQAGELSQEQALGRAGWDRASQHERELLLDMFGISPEQAPQPAPAEPPAAAPEPDRPVPVPFHGVPCQVTPEIVALVDQLQQDWTREAASWPGARAPQAAAEPEMEPQA